MGSSISKDLTSQLSQIILTKPTAAAASGGFLDIMRHPTLRLHTLVMYFNWFTTAFIMYGLALSWQVRKHPRFHIYICISRN